MGSIIGGLLGGGSSTGQQNNLVGASQYQFTGQPGADQNYQSILQNLINTPNYAAQNLPTFNVLDQQAINDPYAGGNQNAANAAGGILSNTAGSDTAAASSLTGAGNSILNTAFDPQSALYNRTVQQLQDQVNASNSMYGLGESPVGASIAGQDLSNFNIDWQNQQLNRQTQGAQSASGLDTAASNLDSAAATAMQQSGSVPYQASLEPIQAGINALTGYNNQGLATQTMPSNILSQLMSYLQGGQSSNVNANNAALGSFNASNTAGSGIANLLGLGNGGLGSILGGGSGSGGSSSIIGGLDPLASSSLPWSTGYSGAGAGGSLLLDQGGSSALDAGGATAAGSSIFSSGGIADAASSLLDFLPALFA